MPAIKTKFQPGDRVFVRHPHVVNATIVRIVLAKKKPGASMYQVEYSLEGEKIRHQQPWLEGFLVEDVTSSSLYHATGIQPTPGAVRYVSDVLHNHPIKVLEDFGYLRELVEEFMNSEKAPAPKKPHPAQGDPLYIALVTEGSGSELNERLYKVCGYNPLDAAQRVARYEEQPETPEDEPTVELGSEEKLIFFVNMDGSVIQLFPLDEIEEI